MRFAERGLDQKSGPGERAAIVTGDQLTVQLKQMQSQPALLRRRLRKRAVELLGPGIAEDRRAFPALPAGCLQSQEIVECRGELHRARLGPERQRAFPLQRPAASTPLRSQ